ncbi:MAG: mercury resistance system periplasmic binding protein MerP [Burkholderiales bacterium]|jgi:mercuric ion binding protein|nr:mercury resistance system periplasmic binding protein MerP [Burkholderiales bacterium]
MLAALPVPAAAAMKTATLSVPGMNCATCPITVNKALGKVDGVTRAQVNLGKRAAVVTFDDARTGIEALARATRDAGYPSMLAGERK